MPNQLNKPVFRKLFKEDREVWQELWAGYLEFYQHELSPEQTALTWQRFFDQKYNLWAFGIEVDGVIVGFAHCSFTNSTWNQTPDLYLEDLFVAPSARRQGLGELLISGCAAFAQERGAGRIHWLTHRDNETAQRVYRKLATMSEFVIFEKKL